MKATLTCWLVGWVDRSGNFRKMPNLNIGSGPFYSTEEAAISLSAYEEDRRFHVSMRRRNLRIGRVAVDVEVD
jgi:hypothetical protein